MFDITNCITAIISSIQISFGVLLFNKSIFKYCCFILVYLQTVSVLVTPLVDSINISALRTELLLFFLPTVSILMYLLTVSLLVYVPTLTLLVWPLTDVTTITVAI
jgi:hypothetical protein